MRTADGYRRRKTGLPAADRIVGRRGEPPNFLRLLHDPLIGSIAPRPNGVVHSSRR